MLEKDFKIFFLNLEDLVIDIFRATQQTPQMFSSKLAGAVTCVMLKKPILNLTLGKNYSNGERGAEIWVSEPMSTVNMFKIFCIKFSERKKLYLRRNFLPYDDSVP